jgi:hypothetical protein
LLGAKISLCRLNRGVPQQQLDLLKLASGGPAELRARTAEVMGRDAGNAGGLGVGFDELPNDLLTQSLAPHSVCSIH